MDAQKKQNIAHAQAVLSSGVVTSEDFDRWAKAVRKQMLNCLQKREGRSPHS